MGSALNTSRRELPAVSAVITCFNQQDFVECAVRSVMRQDRPELLKEIIVVDDGSTDESLSILDALAKQDTRMRVIHQANAGVSAARNRGIREARGSLIALLDGDDRWHPEKLSLQVPRMLRPPAAQLSYTDFISFGNGTRRVLTQELSKDRRKALRAFFIQGGPILPSTMIIDRALFTDIGFFDTHVHGKEDAEFCLRALSCGSARRLGRPLAYRLLHAGSRSADYERKMFYTLARAKHESGRFPDLHDLATQRRTRAYLYCAFRLLGAREYRRASRYIAKAGRLLLRDPRGSVPLTEIMFRQLREKALARIKPPVIPDRVVCKASDNRQ